MELDLSDVRNVHPRPVPATAINGTGGSPIPFTIRTTTTPFAPKVAPGKALDALAGAGVRLTACVLVILSATRALLIGTLIYQEKQFTDAISTGMRSISVTANATAAKTESVEQLKARQELLESYQELANSSREFWTRIAQMVLLNLLLPVLTALLGYVFASKAAGR